MEKKQLIVEELALLSLIRESLFGLTADIPDGVSWEAVYQEAQNQGVCGLIEVNSLHESTLQWETFRYQIVANNVQILFAQRELVQLLQKHGIPSAILKGTAAAIYYPKPYYRTMGDIDIIVPQAFFSTASVLMEKNGYVISHKADDLNVRHIGFLKDGNAIELHHHFSHQDVSIEKYIIDGLKHIEEADINGYVFPMLPSLANGLVLLEHMHSHLQSGMGLRQIIDWMMYVDKVLGDEEWEKQFRQATESIKLDMLAITVTRMCQMYLGLNDDRIHWCRDADENLCERLMYLVITSGNFGRKLGKGNQVETVVMAIRRDGLFRYLQHAGEYNWKDYKQHKWLKPFCWFYQIFRYVKKGIFSGRGKKILADIDRSKERFEVLKKLKVI